MPIILVALCGAFYFYKYPIQALSSVHQKCPDEYADTNIGSTEYIVDTNKWTNDFYDTHPDATLSDWSKARYQFWVDNNCTAALQRYEAYKNGTADPTVVKRVQDGIQEALDNNAN